MLSITCDREPGRRIAAARPSEVCRARLFLIGRQGSRAFSTPSAPCDREPGHMVNAAMPEECCRAHLSHRSPTTRCIAKCPPVVATASPATLQKPQGHITIAGLTLSHRSPKMHCVRISWMPSTSLRPRARPESLCRKATRRMPGSSFPSVAKSGLRLQDASREMRPRARPMPVCSDASSRVPGSLFPIGRQTSRAFQKMPTAACDRRARPKSLCRKAKIRLPGSLFHPSTAKVNLRSTSATDVTPIAIASATMPSMRP
jgi:hypothetical protein